MDFVDVSLNESGQYLLRARNLKRIEKLRFVHNSAVSDTELRREIFWSDDNPINESLIDDFSRRVLRIYQDRGYYKASVEFQFRAKNSQMEDLDIVFNEGPQSRIDRVEIVSRNPNMKTLFRSLINSAKGDAYTEARVSELVQNLKTRLSEERFYRAEIAEPQLEFSQDETRVTVRLPLVRDEQYTIQYLGLSHFTQSEIDEALKLETFLSANPTIGPEFSLRLKNFYLSEGFARAEVSFEEQDSNSTLGVVGAGDTAKTFPSKKLVLTVKEGPKVRIKDLQFTGRIQTANDALVKKLHKFSPDHLRHGVFVRSELDQALEELKVDRQNLGFLKARVVSTRVSFSRDKSQVNVLINFDEGPQTFVSDISFEGNNRLSTEELSRIVPLRLREALKLSQLDESVNALKRHYLSLGYLEYRLLNEKDDLISFNEDGSMARVNFRIVEGPQVRVASIAIEGNTITRSSVIYKELEFKVGEILTPAKVEESMNRLQRLGHFASVDIRTLEDKSSVANRTVIVKVQDRDPGLFNAGFGANNEREFTLRGYSGVSYSNISGAGRATSLRLDGKYNLPQIRTLEGSATFEYLEPYLFDTRTRGKVSFTQSVLVKNYDRLIATETRQFALSAEQDLTSHLLVGYDLIRFARYRDYSLKSEDDFPTILTDISTTGPSATLDYRDHPFNPTSGTFSQGSLDYAHPAIGSTPDIEFALLSLGSTHYQPVVSTWVWANSLKWSYLQNRQARGSIPYDKVGFQVGGLKSVRGFQPGEAYPNRLEFGTDTYRLKTEATMAIYKSELRFPLWKNFGGAFFYDGGYIDVRGLALVDHFRDSVGVSFRLNTPVGPFSIDYGWKLDRQNLRHENDGVVHISIGNF